VSRLYLKIRPRPLRLISYPVTYSGRVLAKLVGRHLPTAGPQNAIPGHVKWDLW
jgi:hypothetical protein